MPKSLGPQEFPDTVSELQISTRPFEFHFQKSNHSSPRIPENAREIIRKKIEKTEDRGVREEKRGEKEGMKRKEDGGKQEEGRGKRMKKEEEGGRVGKWGE